MTGAVIEVEERRHGDHRQRRRRCRQRGAPSGRALTENVKIGKIYDGRVTSVKDFARVIEIIPGKDGLCHISELADGFVNSVHDVCKVGATRCRSRSSPSTIKTA